MTKRIVGAVLAMLVGVAVWLIDPTARPYGIPIMAVGAWMLWRAVWEDDDAS